MFLLEVNAASVFRWIVTEPSVVKAVSEEGSKSGINLISYNSACKKIYGEIRFRKSVLFLVSRYIHYTYNEVLKIGFSIAELPTLAIYFVVKHLLI